MLIKALLATTSVLFLFSASGCRKTKDIIENFLTFEINRAVPPQTIESSLAPCQIATLLDIPIAGLSNVQFSQEQDFPEQNTEVRLIRSAKFETLSFTLIEQSAQKNWDWLESITIYIASSARAKEKLASIPSVANGLTNLNFTVENVDIANHIKAEGGFTLSSDAKGCPPPNTTEFSGSYRIKVSASPL